MASISTSTSNGSSEASQAWLLYAVSFWGGFQIMVLEMCGFRVLQTNLGSSVIVTGTLLTLIMVLLSAGYYTGGRLSRRFCWLRASIRSWRQRY
jgi:small-conductance mechanosensitive channel